MEDTPPGVAAWKEHTTAFDRVRSISQTLDQPQTAKYIAAEAAVSETTANDHLKRLVEMNVIRAIKGTNATLYEPDPLYSRFRTLRRLIDEHDQQELLELKSTIQQQIETLEAEYEVESPSNLRELAAGTETSPETMQLIKHASDWDLSLYNLSVINDAIGNYSEYTELDRRVQA